MSILIKNVLHENDRLDVYIKDNRIEQIAKNIDIQAETVIAADNMAIFPSFVNAHNHAAMTLLRGYADDMALHKWLSEHIWPLEAKLTEEDIYVGAKLAALEMIKSGTTFFNDMYWHWHGTARAVEEMGMRAALSAVFIDFGDEKQAAQQKEANELLLEQSKKYSERILFTLGPHAIYTVSEKSLTWCRDFAEKHDLLIHLHISETKKEVDDCLAQHSLRPIHYLDQLGLLSPRLIACHAVWLDDQEIKLLAEKGVKIVHNPVSNMKLCSGSLRYDALKDAGLTIGLGTDGCSSNNNLDMFEEMKFAAVYAKTISNDPTTFTAEQAFHAATTAGAEIFALNCGKIEAGKLADCILINLDHPQCTPHYNLVSNMVYSTSGDIVDTTICNGKILMRGRKVEGEQEIIHAAREVAQKLSLAKGNTNAD